MIKIIAGFNTFPLSDEHVINVGDEHINLVTLAFPISPDEIYTPLSYRTRKILMRRFTIKGNGRCEFSVCLPTRAAQDLKIKIENLRMKSELRGIDYEVNLSGLMDIKATPTEEELDKWLEAIESAVARKRRQFVETFASEIKQIVAMEKRVAALQTGI